MFWGFYRADGSRRRMDSERDRLEVYDACRIRAEFGAQFLWFSLRTSSEIGPSTLALVLMTSPILSISPQRELRVNLNSMEMSSGEEEVELKSKIEALSLGRSTSMMSLASVVIERLSPAGSSIKGERTIEPFGSSNGTDKKGRSGSEEM